MKAIKKLHRKITRRPDPEATPAARITNDTVAEHREKILAGGRRFKYPMQYARGRLVRNTILISLGAIALLVVLGWWQLYPAQNTSKFMYRVTQIVPAPVASVDGQSVRYSDYLMRLRSAIHYLEREDTVNFETADGKRQLDYQKRDSLDKAVNAAYVAKLARQNKIDVTNQEVESFIDAQITGSGRNVSRAEFESSVIRDYYDWDIGEYRSFVREQLLRGKVAIAVDTAAKAKADDILKQLQGGKDFAAVAKEQSDDELTKAGGGDAGVQSKSATDNDGLIKAAGDLPVGSLSGIIQTRTGYYIIKTTENRAEEVRYQRIFVSLKELDRQLSALRSGNKISEYIDVTDNTAPVQN